MEQERFEWAEQMPGGEAEASEVELERETIEAVIELMARALIAVLRSDGEVPDER